MSHPSLPLAPELDRTPNPLDSIYRLYAAIAATCALDREAGLGGKLLYAGAIDAEAGGLLYAANIAGAATLAASSDPAVQRQAIRDGKIDFLVTSLEEALRILKNEIRKHQPVSVGVAVDPFKIADQMLDRGVLPDLLPPATWSESAAGMSLAQAGIFLGQGAPHIADPTQSQGKFVAWSAAKDFTRWLPLLDACALAAVPANDNLRQRWLRLAPRYLGRMAQRIHGVALNSEEVAQFTEAARAMIQLHDPAAPVEIQSHE